ARRGYWAATTEDISKAEKAEKANVASVVDANKPVMEALANISVNVQAGKYVRTWLGTERGQNGKTKITLVWEPLPKAASNANTPTAGRVSLIAATDAGDLVYRGRPPDAPQFASVNAPAPAGSVAQSAGAGANANAPQMMTFEARP